MVFSFRFHSVFNSCISPSVLTNLDRVAHICVDKLTPIGSDNDLSPGRRQAIIWTNSRISLIGPLWTNFSEILIEIYAFSFKKWIWKCPLAKWGPFCLGLNASNQWIHFIYSTWNYCTTSQSDLVVCFVLLLNVTIHWSDKQIYILGIWDIFTSEYAIMHLSGVFLPVVFGNVD